MFGSQILWGKTRDKENREKNKEKLKLYLKSIIYFYTLVQTHLPYNYLVSLFYYKE